MVNTVLGPIKSSDMGITLTHEHITCFSHSMRQCFKERWFNTDELIAAAARLLKNAREQCGIKTLIDGTPNDLGRDVDILRAVSKLSGVNIVASSGMYYHETPFLYDKSPEFFADFFIHECMNGTAGTKIFPGVLKCATSKNGFTSTNIMLLKTMAIVQRETKLPLFAHNTHHIKTAPAQLDILEDNGVDLSRVTVGHCSDTSDINYLESLLNRGCYLGFDRIWANADKAQVSTVCTLINRGWSNRLMLSHDYCVFIDFGNESWEKTKARGFNNLNRDYTTIHRTFLPALKNAGITEKQIEQMLIKNPAEFFEYKGP